MSGQLGTDVRQQGVAMPAQVLIALLPDDLHTAFQRVPEVAYRPPQSEQDEEALNGSKNGASNQVHAAAPEFEDCKRRTTEAREIW